MVDIQTTSFKEFLNQGLTQVLDSFPNILDPTGRLELMLYGKDYQIRFPKYSVRKAKKRDRTYSIQIYLPAKLNRKDLQLDSIKDITKKDKRKNRKYGKRLVFIADLPIMTNRGSFIISGTSRVIVNQIVRSPGIYYKQEIDKKGNSIYSANLISNRGSWLKFEVDAKGSSWIRIDKANKINTYIFLKAIGLSDNDLRKNLNNYSFFMRSCDIYQEKDLDKETDKNSIYDITSDDALKIGAICS